MSFYLKYSNDNWSTSTKMEITNAINNKENKEVVKQAGRTLRQRDYEHRLATKTVRTIALSANFLSTTANKSFITSFLTAGARRYSDDDVTYDDVVVDLDGDLPYEYINNHSSLPEIEFKLINKDTD